MRHRRRPCVNGFLGLALVLVLPALARAVDPGDILFTDNWYGLIYAESISGNQHHVGPPSIVVAQGLGAVVTDGIGNIYALLASAGEVFKIDATTGAYATVSSGGYLQYPGSICLLPGGDLIVTDHGPTGGVVRVNPNSGVQTPLYLGYAAAATVSGSGVLHVALLNAGTCYLYRMDAATGDTVRVSSTPVSATCSLATDGDGNLIVAQSNQVKRVYPSLGGAVQLLSSGGQLEELHGVTVEGNGTIVVSDAHATIACDPPGGPETCVGRLFRIDPVNGAQTLMSQGGYWRLGAIDVYRGPHADTPTKRVTWGNLKTLYR